MVRVVFFFFCVQLLFVATLASKNEAHLSSEGGDQVTLVSHIMAEVEKLSKQVPNTLHYAFQDKITNLKKKIPTKSCYEAEFTCKEIARLLKDLPVEMRNAIDPVKKMLYNERMARAFLIRLRGTERPLYEILHEHSRGSHDRLIRQYHAEQEIRREYSGEAKKLDKLIGLLKRIRRLVQSLPSRLWISIKTFRLPRGVKEEIKKNILENTRALP